MKKESDSKKVLRERQAEADRSWKESFATKNAKMAKLAEQESTEKVNSTTGGVAAGIVEIWPDGQKYKGWDLEEFGEIILDVQSAEDPLYGPLCALQSAMEKGSKWKGIKLLLNKIHKVYLDKNKSENE